MRTRALRTRALRTKSCCWRQVLILLFASSFAHASAQDRGVDPLPQQIHQLEVITSRSPGVKDGEAWLKLARLRQDAARYRDAEQAYRKAIALLKSRRPILLAEAMDDMGTLYAECGEYAKASRLERKALAIREQEDDVPGIGRSHTHLALLLLAKNDLASADGEAQVAVTVLGRETARSSFQPSPSPEDRMSALVSLSLIRCAMGDCPSAIPQLKIAIGIANRNYAESSIPVGFLTFLLGYALWKSGDVPTAEEYLSTGTRELSTQLSWGHPMYVRAMQQYAEFLAQTGKAREAQEVRAKISRFEQPPGTIDIQSLAFR